MSRNVILFLVSVMILPAAILGGSMIVESHPSPKDCSGRDAWMSDATARFTTAEGEAGAVDRYTGIPARLKNVADSYANAAKAQLNSNPPASDVQSNALIAQYYQTMGENWAGWVTEPYLSVHTDADLETLRTSLHSALVQSQVHCR